MGGLERTASLATAATLRRTIHASLERVWENVRDWEHLPWLHRSAFASIELLDSGAWGWRARVGFAAGAEAEIELIIDAPASRYVARTLSGAAAGSEIWTRLTPESDQRTRIEVDFCVTPLPKEALEAVGALYLRLYTQLWDEDEAMMQAREAALARRPGAACAEVVELGPLASLRERLPLVVPVGGRLFRVVEVEGRLHVHSTLCPHWLGPLAEADPGDGRLVCPWHGYAFDLESGRSCDGRGLRLARAPRLETSPDGSCVRLVATEG